MQIHKKFDPIVAQTRLERRRRITLRLFTFWRQLICNIYYNGAFSVCMFVSLHLTSMKVSYFLICPFYKRGCKSTVFVSSILMYCKHIWPCNMNRNRLPSFLTKFLLIMLFKLLCNKNIFTFTYSKNKQNDNTDLLIEKN